MYTAKRFIILCFVLLVSGACNIAQIMLAEPTEAPTATGGSTGGVVSAPTSVPSEQPPTPIFTQEAAQEAVTLDPCTLLSREEATDILGEVVGEAKINGGACTYADAASGVHVLSVYAFQGEQARNQWSGRLFLLSAFGLQIDQPTVDEIKALDEAGNQKTILEKVTALSAGSTAFISRSLDGLGEIAYWAWKDLGYGVRQGFLVAVKGDIIAGMDIVHGESLDEPMAVDSAMKVVSLIFGRLPARFTISLAAPATEAVTATPTSVPTATPVPTEPSLPTPTLISDTGKRIAF